MRSGSVIDDLKKCKYINFSMHLYICIYLKKAFKKCAWSWTFYTIIIILLIRRKAFKNLLYMYIQILKLERLDLFFTKNIL